MGKKKKDEAAVKLNDQAWMGTLADLVFLLITFFVLLISMSSLNAKKLREAFGLFDSAVDVMNFPKDGGGSDSFVNVITSVTNFMAEQSTETKVKDKDKEKAAEQLLKEMIQAMMGNNPDESTIGTLKTLAQKVGGTLKIEKYDDGFSVTLPGKILFPTYDTTLTERGMALLKDVAAILKIWGGKIDVISEWSWHEASAIQTQVINVLEDNWIKGELITPKVSPIARRTITFVMRSGE